MLHARGVVSLYGKCRAVPHSEQLEHYLTPVTDVVTREREFGRPQALVSPRLGVILMTFYYRTDLVSDTLVYRSVYVYHD